MGLVAATRLSQMLGHADADLADRVEMVVEHIGLEPVLPPSIEVDAITEGMLHDKKKRGSQPRFVLLKGIGDPFVTDEVTPAEITAVLGGMRSRRAAGSLG